MSLKQLERPDDLMTAADAGRILGLSVDMIRLIARDGKLPFLSTISGVRLFRRKDVEALARQRARAGRKSGVRRRVTKARSR
jgi:DNA-binding transcriptional MerR regulator